MSLWMANKAIKEFETKEILLPTSETALDTFVASIIKHWKLPDTDDTYDAIATMILHLNHNKAYASRKYFADGVLKSLANKSAFDKLQVFRKRREEAEKTKLSLVENEATNSSESPNSSDTVSGQSV